MLAGHGEMQEFKPVQLLEKAPWWYFKTLKMELLTAWKAKKILPSSPKLLLSGILVKHQEK